MGKYTGSQCIICQNAFTDDEDIVVCPDCGTPYHRACWEAKGKCINSSLHAVGGSWTSIQQESRMRSGGVVCPHCQHVNLPDAKICESCNGSLPTAEGAGNTQNVRIPLPDGETISFEANDPCCGLSPNEPVEEETLGDVASFVRTNTLYYVPLFRRFRDTRRKTSLNLSCMLFPHLYFAYRKMWPMALLASLILLICNLPTLLMGILTTLETPEFMERLTEMYGTGYTAMFDGLLAFLQANQTFIENLNVPLYLASLVVRMLFCLFGNYLYYRFVLKRVGHIRQHSPNDHIRRTLLQVDGGTSIWNIIGCFAIYEAAPIVLLMVLMLRFM